jgi:predicted SAM-dependent methyltransferase
MTVLKKHTKTRFVRIASPCLGIELPVIILKIRWGGYNNILMFGAEYSIKKWFDRNGYHYTTADLFDRSADIKADIQNTPFADETWDLIICNHVLEHVPNYKNALIELRRILKINGKLELTVPTDRSFEKVYEDLTITSKEERIKAFGQYDHVRIFGNNFEQILLELGFSVEVIDGNELPAKIVGEIGPANYDDNRVYICKGK